MGVDQLPPSTVWSNILPILNCAKYICSRWVMFIIDITFSNSSIIAVTVFFTKIDRNRFMATDVMSMMVYSSLLFNFVRTYYDIQIRRYEASVVNNLIILYLLTMIIKYLGGYEIWFDSTCQVSFLQQQQVLYCFRLCSCKINTCMEALSLCVAYKPLVGSNEGDLVPHISQTKYFYEMKDNVI